MMSTSLEKKYLMRLEFKWHMVSFCKQKMACHIHFVKIPSGEIQDKLTCVVHRKTMLSRLQNVVWSKATELGVGALGRHTHPGE